MLPSVVLRDLTLPEHRHLPGGTGDFIITQRGVHSDEAFPNHGVSESLLTPPFITESLKD